MNFQNLPFTYHDTTLYNSRFHPSLNCTWFRIFLCFWFSCTCVFGFRNIFQFGALKTTTCTGLFNLYMVFFGILFLYLIWYIGESSASKERCHAEDKKMDKKFSASKILPKIPHLNHIMKSLSSYYSTLKSRKKQTNKFVREAKTCTSEK